MLILMLMLCAVNFCLMSEPQGIDTTQINDLERQGLRRSSEFHRLGSAYALEQATRPSTIGLVLSASQLALLAWFVVTDLTNQIVKQVLADPLLRIAEKFLDWTDTDPLMDLILESVTLYWLTNTFPRFIHIVRFFSPYFLIILEKQTVT